ncbi:unnamed protein product, partial [Mesorhabditis spiculigera]
MIEEFLCGDVQVDFDVKKINYWALSALHMCKVNADLTTHAINIKTIVDFANVSSWDGTELWRDSGYTVWQVINSQPLYPDWPYWMLPIELLDSHPVSFTEDLYNITTLSCQPNAIQFRICRRENEVNGTLVQPLHKGWFDDDLYKWIEIPLQLQILGTKGNRWTAVKRFMKSIVTNQWLCKKDNASKLMFPGLEGGVVKEVDANAADFTYIRGAHNLYVIATKLKARTERQSC